MGQPHRGYFGAIPSGIAGVRATLDTMVKVAREFLKPPVGHAAKTDSLLCVRMAAMEIVQCVPEKQYYREIAALHEFTRDRIRYTMDMLNAETVQYPDVTLEIQAGDCDDKSLLFCCLANCIGYDTRFCAVGVNGGDFSHVSGQALIPGRGWVNAETIPIDDAATKVPLGWFPPDATCIMLRNI